MRITRRKKRYSLQRGVGDGLPFYESKNCQFFGGTLRAGLGVKAIKAFENQAVNEFLVNNSVRVLWVGGIREEEAYTPVFAALGDSGYLYLFGGNDKGKLAYTSVKFDEDALLTPIFEEETSLQIAVHGNQHIYTVKRNGSAIITYVGQNIRVGAFLHGRLYYANEYEVLCTGPYEYLMKSMDADNEGRILADRACGRIVAILAYGERLFVLQEYGAFFLEGGGSLRDFVVKKVPRLGGRAVLGGACAIGKDLFYLCEDGLYQRTEGNDGRLVSRRVEDVDFSKPLKATAVEKRYRLAYFDKQGVERTRIFDGESGESYESFSLQAVCGNGVTFGVSEGKIVELAEGGELPSGESRIATSYPFDFGKNSEKTLRRVCLAGQGRVELVVRSERGFKRASLDLSTGGAAATVLKGRKFEIELTLSADAAVESVEVEYDEVEDDGNDD